MDSLTQLSEASRTVVGMGREVAVGICVHFLEGAGDDLAYTARVVLQALVKHANI